MAAPCIPPRGALIPWIPEKSLSCGAQAPHRPLQDSAAHQTLRVVTKGCSPGFISEQNATASLQKETVCIQTKLTQIQNKALGNRIPDKSRDFCNSFIKLNKEDGLEERKVQEVFCAVKILQKWQSHVKPTSSLKIPPQQQNHIPLGLPSFGDAKQLVHVAGKKSFQLLEE